MHIVVIALLAGVSPIGAATPGGGRSMQFERNLGQAPRHVEYAGYSAAYRIGISGTGVLFSDGAEGGLHVEMRWGNHARKGRCKGLDATGAYTSYYSGGVHVEGVPVYERVAVESIYDGIDAVFHGSDGRWEFDFVLKPGADPALIELEFQGAESLSIEDGGALVIRKARQQMRLGAPVLYQLSAGRRKAVEGAYRRAGPSSIRFQTGKYDASIPLVIDPVLESSSYAGGSGYEEANAMTIDSSGNVYVVGETESRVMTPNPTGGARTPSDAFVQKLNAQGQPAWTLFFGGTQRDAAQAVRVDSRGRAYVAGWTSSAVTFGVTRNVVQPAYGGGQKDAFVARVQADGRALEYLTYLGGVGADAANAILVDSGFGAVVAGTTESPNFPVTEGAFLKRFPGGESDGFLARLNADGTAVVYGTFLGGRDRDEIYALDMDGAGNLYAGGATYSRDFPLTEGAFRTAAGPRFDGFVCKLTAAGAMEYSTLIGGSADSRILQVKADPQGRAVFAGWTTSSDFPVTPDAFQASYGGKRDVVWGRFDRAGQALEYATYLGGDGEDAASGLALDQEGNVYVAGTTTSEEFPGWKQGFQGRAGGQDAFVAAFGMSGERRLFSAYIGGSGDERNTAVEIDSRGRLYVTGGTSSAAFPLVAASQQKVLGGGFDAFLARLDFSFDLPLLIASPGRLNFQTVPGKLPADQQVEVATSLGQADGWSVETSTEDGAGWLMVSPSEGSAPGKLTVGVISRDLTLGTYNGAVTLIRRSTGTRAVIPVRLTVGESVASEFMLSTVTESRLATVPEALAMDRQGNLYVAQGSTVAKVNTSTGALTTVADLGPGTVIRGLAIDADGAIYATEWPNVAQRRVVKIVPATGARTVIAGGGPGTGESALQARFFSPGAVELDDQGNLYIADGVQVWKVLLRAGRISKVASTQSAGDLAADSKGNLYVADSAMRVIQRLEAGASSATIFAGRANTIGSSGDGGAAASALFRTPSGVAVDSTGNIIITDNNANTIRIIDAAGGLIRTVAGVLNASTLQAPDGPASSTAVPSPAYPTVDQQGTIYFVDQSNRKIRKLTPTLH